MLQIKAQGIVQKPNGSLGMQTHVIKILEHFITHQQGKNERKLALTK